MTGDQYGPYDPDTVKEERDRLKAQKVTCARLHCSQLVCILTCVPESGLENNKAAEPLYISSVYGFSLLLFWALSMSNAI